MVNFKKKFGAAVLAGVMLAGCSSGNSGTAENGWPETFVVTTSVDENNPDADAMNDQFGEDLSEYLGIPVEVYSASDYTMIVEGMAAGNVNASLVSPMSYFHVKERTNIELVASAKMAAEYRSAFITQGDNDEINSLEDLEGHSFAFVDQASSSGYLYPKATLCRDLDLDPDQLENSDYFFSTVAFSGNHQTSLMGVAMGDYDAACVAESIVAMMEQAGQLEEGALKIIGTTDDIPNPAYVINADLPQDLKDKFKEFLMTYDNADFFEVALGSADMRFGETSEEDFQPAKDVIDFLGLEMGEE